MASQIDFIEFLQDSHDIGLSLEDIAFANIVENLKIKKNNQLKTNTALQMKNAGIEFKVV